jgi:hypothetical protein
VRITINTVSTKSRAVQVHFRENDEMRRLSPALITRMKDPALRFGLREFIFWNIMERNFATQSSKDPPKVIGPFNPDKHDWRLLGDAMAGMAQDEEHEKRHPSARRFMRFLWRWWNGETDREEFRCWWSRNRTYVFNRWPEHKPQLGDLYALIERVYLKPYLKPESTKCPT